MKLFKTVWSLAALTLVLMVLSQCSSHEDASLKDATCPQGWTKVNPRVSWPRSIFGKTIPLGQMPGVVVTFKTTGFGGYDKHTVTLLKDGFKKEFFKQALPDKPTHDSSATEKLFFTAIAIDASAVVFLREATLRSQSEVEMQEAYDEVPADKKDRFVPEDQDIEKYILIVDDSSTATNLHSSLGLPEFGAAIIDKNLCRSPNYNLPAAKDALIAAVKNFSI